MRAYYSDTFNLPLPEGHRFPGQKYAMLRERLLHEGLLAPDELHLSPLAEDADIARAHDADYIAAFESGSLDPRSMRRIGFPWSEHLVRRTRASTGGAVAATRAALADGISGQLAGGTHHAHRDFGAGYCIYNDQAVAALRALADGWAERLAVVDLDVHQGDGTAAILGANPSVFVFSMHGEKNFPFRKRESDLDVPLPDGMEDAAYLRMLAEHLPAVFAFRPDLVLYQAGVDPLAEDKLGRLALTHDGLMARDEMVLRECARRGIPVAMAIGGGYANPIQPSVAAYANTYRIVRRIHGPTGAVAVRRNTAQGSADRLL
ncbi:acetoin utilization deacetylase AcuC-like enzyme [Dichotomicrobium thermohalophilum]|uniref:Acetoin utilization deacetylase AcuC-like enzyme n=2 Tax=Dichotomicrobium thermohalophilum TaxID=933063 RepID=A0A397Q482_9HYPH|nr:acetoin utilization deacetylase AcuC-like enzyme [Dichotomicrobium thermohalophilum]